MSAVPHASPRLVIDVDNLSADGWAFRGDLPADRVTQLLNRPANAEITALGSLAVALKAYKAGQGLRLEGAVAVNLGRPCGRCLTLAPLDITLKVDMTLFPAPRSGAAPAADAEAEGRRKGRKRRAAERAEVNLPPAWEMEDENTGTYQDGKVDVEHVLRELLLLEVPFTHECRPDCKGLCQQCGQDLNTGPCSCRPQVDGRLAALANIKIQ